MKAVLGARAVIFVLSGILVMFDVGGCGAKAVDVEDPSPPIVRGSPPSYAEVARGYNERCRLLTSLWSGVVIRIDYEDEDGGEHREQGEGVLQVMQPDRLALSINKVGAKRLFWFGSDQNRYWWFDLIDEHVQYVGRHDRFGLSGERIGLPIAPLDLIRVLGNSPLEEDRGAVQWSRNGHMLGVTTRLSRGFQRIWMDPADYFPKKIELYDAGKAVVLVADLSEPKPVAVQGVGRRPRTAGRILISQPEQNLMVRLNLGTPEVSETRPSADAFDMTKLQRALRVDRTVDLDRERAGRVSDP